MLLLQQRVNLLEIGFRLVVRSSLINRHEGTLHGRVEARDEERKPTMRHTIRRMILCTSSDFA